MSLNDTTYRGWRIFTHVEGPDVWAVGRKGALSTSSLRLNAVHESQSVSNIEERVVTAVKSEINDFVVRPFTCKVWLRGEEKSLGLLEAEQAVFEMLAVEILASPRTPGRQIVKIPSADGVTITVDGETIARVVPMYPVAGYAEMIHLTFGL